MCFIKYRKKSKDELNILAYLPSLHCSPSGTEYDGTTWTMSAALKMGRGAAGFTVRKVSVSYDKENKKNCQ